MIRSKPIEPQRHTERLVAAAKEMVPIAKSETEPHALHARPRGRPASGKVRLTLLVDPTTIARYRATGKGWQSRMADALEKAAPSEADVLVER